MTVSKPLNSRGRSCGNGLDRSHGTGPNRQTSMAKFNVASLIGRTAFAVVHRNRVNAHPVPGTGEAGSEPTFLAVRHPDHNRSILRAMNTPFLGSRADGSKAFARRES
jgi:hypothetical protein